MGGTWKEGGRRGEEGGGEVKRLELEGSTHNLFEPGSSPHSAC